MRPTVDSKLRAIIFDLDGLLVDTEPVFYGAMATVLQRHGATLTREEYISKDLQNGDSVLDTLAEHRTITEIQHLQREIYAEYGWRLRHGIKAMPGADATLRSLRSRYTLAIASSSRRVFINYVLKKHGWRDWFAVIVSRESTKNLKPEPDCLIKASQELHVKLEQCVLVEDSKRGLSAAKKVGIPCIIVPNEMTRGASYDGAAATLVSLAEVPQFLEGLW